MFELRTLPGIISKRFNCHNSRCNTRLIECLYFNLGFATGINALHGDQVPVSGMLLFCTETEQMRQTCKYNGGLSNDSIARLLVVSQLKQLAHSPADCHRLQEMLLVRQKPHMPRIHRTHTHIQRAHTHTLIYKYSVGNMLIWRG